MKISSLLHLLLLAYIIAALSFWWLSLEKQSRTIYLNEISTLKEHIDPQKTPQKYADTLQKIEFRRASRSKQYLGEGLTFLVIILIGSGIVYSNYRFSNRLARQQNNFMLSVTHELKSPIAAMKLTLQTLQKHKLDLDKQQQLLTKCIAEADRLNELCDNVLIASQMEGGHYHNERETISITNLIQNTFDEYDARYPNRFESFIGQQIDADTDQVLLQLVVNNVLENAIKYTPNETKIQLRLETKGAKIVIAIADLGEGIPDIEKRKIFNQFYRVGDERTRKTKGTGLGLYLSKKIMKTLRGSIVVKDNQPKGALFEICIPLSTA
jgi:K+-sensing histidine kinase KdpD